MTEDNKKILFGDLCARLPYGVKVQLLDGNHIGGITELNEPILTEIRWYNQTYKPYLRPMSSMTEEEEKEFKNSCKIIGFYKDGEFACTPDGYDWLNKHHFDYRGLIPMGLALEAQEGMYDA